MNKDLESENESLRSQNMDAVKEIKRLTDCLKELHDITDTDKKCSYCRARIEEAL